jgi:hypothetical protein
VMLVARREVSIKPGSKLFHLFGRFGLGMNFGRTRRFPSLPLGWTPYGEWQIKRHLCRRGVAKFDHGDWQSDCFRRGEEMFVRPLVRRVICALVLVMSLVGGLVSPAAAAVATKSAPFVSSAATAGSSVATGPSPSHLGQVAKGSTTLATAPVALRRAVVKDLGAGGRGVVSAAARPGRPAGVVQLGATYTSTGL